MEESINAASTEGCEEKELYNEPNARTIVLTMVLAFILPIIIMALALQIGRAHV